jgi:hypothetical protein
MCTEDAHIPHRRDRFREQDVDCILDENHSVAIAKGSRLPARGWEPEKVNEEKRLRLIRGDRRGIDVVPIRTEVFQNGIESQVHREVTN